MASGFRHVWRQEKTLVGIRVGQLENIELLANRKPALNVREVVLEEAEAVWG